ncbi:hypothetical protein [Rhodoferax sp.]|uniref:hypothetical protein n=1 Tax=Rhodoferax sp. TaxID=50421 RepID=UPI0025E90E56|nr:hypothetical protein [Rhodoferax sp.]
MKPRLWTDYQELRAYVKRTVDLSGKSLTVLCVEDGWKIPDHYSLANGGYPDWYYEEQDEGPQADPPEMLEMAPSHLVPGWLGGTSDLD